jgi:starch phosphorylase
MKPLKSYIVKAKIPQELKKLEKIARNYWWCWDSDAKDLFYSISPTIWKKVNHNPIELINKVGTEKLTELSRDKNFLNTLDFVYYKLDKYLNNISWHSQNYQEQKNVIAYFSTEYGINESFPNYSGGLGVLSGDHLKSASDLGIPLVGVGLLYQEGYFRQRLLPNGWQSELYKFNNFNSMPLELLKDNNGNTLKVNVDILGTPLFAQIWKAQIGRVALYLLDTNIPDNPNQEQKEVTFRLYGGTRETRIQQEILLGIGGMRALSLLGYNPYCLHINEGHAAFALLERTKEMMLKHSLNFWAAKEIVKSSSVFTTHTPVPAGNEAFKIDRISEYFKSYWKELGLSREEFIRLGQQEHFNEVEDFSMTVLGLKLSSYHNGVSALHGVVSRRMWQNVWRGFPIEEVPIGSITNGIHTYTWVARELAELFDKYLGENWRNSADDKKVWDLIRNIPNEELWREKQKRKHELITFSRNYLKEKKKSYISKAELSNIDSFLSTDALTIGFARRFATYKRATLIFQDMDRLKKILCNNEHPVQMIIAGKAHPHDVQGKEVIQQIIQKVKAYGLENKVVFLEDYDMQIGRLLVKGCDVWLNNPIRPLEASGTSGMKAGLNGTLNFSVLDGWWDESFNGTNGFAIGEGEEYDNPDEGWQIEANQTYDMLENSIVKTFYSRQRNIPIEWITMMKESIRTIAPEYSTSRMLKDYYNKYYSKAVARFETMDSNNAENTRQFRAWKDRLLSEWGKVKIVEVQSSLDSSSIIDIEEELEVVVKAHLAGLTKDDVDIQVVFGKLNHKSEITNYTKLNLEWWYQENENEVFKLKFKSKVTGRHGLTIRIVPKHRLLELPQEIYLVNWA